MVDPLAAAAAREVVMAGAREIVMVGCGDSLFAAMGAAFAFARFGGRFAVPLDALEYSRGFYRTSGAQTLVCALSYSGETRRTLEAAIAACSRSARLLAVSADAEGSIARLAQYVLPNVSPRDAERSNCRTGSYQAAHLALVLLAAHIAVEDGASERDLLARVHSEIRALAEGVEHSLDQARVAGREASRLLRRASTVYFLGGGEGHAAARYGAAKLYETSSLPVVPQETEQFAHCEIFSLEPDSVAVVIALRGPFYERSVEVADAIRRIGATVVGVSDDPGFERHADLALSVIADGFGDFAGNLAVLPLQWMAFYDAVWRGQDPDLVRHKAVNSPLIREAPIWSADDFRRLDQPSSAR